ncbi:DUF4912 domain-containing protein [Methylomonas albis]|uniref:DUF4912 domain-containing protein n=1 Tax=Methylomonas albis TaxID=1854563 RepID=A0ABR9D416_9GAMM|nr:DUF4912 domain-containing protein [Methylomonas albis]MBD9357867.1 DUF4912 domain-containing protein [Methylomonas albis]
MALSSSQSQVRAPLSAEEMRAISLEISRGFAPRRFRAGAARLTSTGFSPQELLSISQQISREFAPRAETAIELKRAKLVALPVDPEHLHVYWQLDEAPQVAVPIVEPVEEVQPLTLRVYSQSDPTEAATAPAEAIRTWFDVPVAAERSQQQIALPGDCVYMAGIYQVAIGRLNQQQEFNALAYSNTTAAAPQISPITERLSPAMAQFIILPSQASSALAVTASGQKS